MSTDANPTSPMSNSVRARAVLAPHALSRHTTLSAKRPGYLPHLTTSAPHILVWLAFGHQPITVWEATVRHGIDWLCSNSDGKLDDLPRHQKHRRRPTTTFATSHPAAWRPPLPNPCQPCPCPPKTSLRRRPPRCRQQLHTLTRMPLPPSFNRLRHPPHDSTHTLTATPAVGAHCKTDHQGHIHATTAHVWTSVVPFFTYTTHCPVRMHQDHASSNTFPRPSTACLPTLLDCYTPLALNGATLNAQYDSQPNPTQPETYPRLQPAFKIRGPLPACDTTRRTSYQPTQGGAPSRRATRRAAQTPPWQGERRRCCATASRRRRR